jgi:hypothetical protein
VIEDSENSDAIAETDPATETEAPQDTCRDLDIKYGGDYPHEMVSIGQCPQFSRFSFEDAPPRSFPPRLQFLIRIEDGE